MDAAREADAPQFTLYDDALATVGAPADGPYRRWRAPRRPLARRLGIGGGVALAAVLLVTVLSAPIGAAIGWLTGLSSERPQEQTAASPEDAVPVTPTATVGPDDPPPLARALSDLVDDAFEATAQAAPPAPEGRVARVTALDAVDRPLAWSVPVPSFKPPSADQ